MVGSGIVAAIIGALLVFLFQILKGRWAAERKALEAVLPWIRSMEAARDFVGEFVVSYRSVSHLDSYRFQERSKNCFGDLEKCRLSDELAVMVPEDVGKECESIVKAFGEFQPLSEAIYTLKEWTKPSTIYVISDAEVHEEQRQKIEELQVRLNEPYHDLCRRIDILQKRVGKGIRLRGWA